jgi:hypothetical protein
MVTSIHRTAYDQRNNKLVITSAMPSSKGIRPPAAGRGRPAGSKNRFGQEAKEALALAFEGIGGVPALVSWAETHREAFYKLYAKLIPVELNGSATGGAIQVIITPTESRL